MTSLGNGNRGGIDAEIQHHIDELVEMLVDEGWAPDAARREAERRFGDVGRIREEVEVVHRKGLSWTWLRTLGTDARQGLRSLLKRPGYVLSVIATLALGLGAAASIFAVVDAFLLRPMAFRDADRWVEVDQASNDGGYFFGLSTERYTAWRDALGNVADGWLAFAPTQVVRTDGPEPESLSSVVVTPGTASQLGIPVLFGRAFTAEDALPGAPAVAVLTREYWERLGGQRDVLGDMIHTEAGDFTVVGVLQGGVRFPIMGPPRSLWVALRTDFTWGDRPLKSFQGVWARLRPGVGVGSAQERADVLADGLAEEQPSDRTWKVRFVPLSEPRVNPDIRQALWTLAATVGAIFLIALVNGVNLTLVRASARVREVAVRVAIGGSRPRIVRHFLIEGGILGVLGAGAAVLLAVGSIATLRGILPVRLAWFARNTITVETRTLASIGALALLVALALGLIPAVRTVVGLPLSASLAARGAEDRPRVRRFRNGLVILQVALTTTLLVVAGLLSRSMIRLVHEDPGFDAEHVAITVIQPSSVRYQDAAARWALADRLEEALKARPEVADVTVISDAGISFSGTGLQAEGNDPPPGQPEIIPNGTADVDYVSGTGATLVTGRSFTGADAGTENVLIDEDLAHLLWPAGSAVGQRFRMDESDPWMTVVGVLKELRLDGRDQRPGPYQFLRARNPERGGYYLEVVVRTTGEPAALIPIIRDALKRVDPEQVIYKAETGVESLAGEEGTPRFLLTVMGLLAAIATALSSVGLYGVLAYSVGCRRRELGIRMALGAHRGRVRAKVMREGLAIVAVGMVLGLVGAATLSGTLAKLLYRLEPLDPVTMLAVVAVLSVVSALAASGPARRATRVDPMEVLRSE